MLKRNLAELSVADGKLYRDAMARLITSHGGRVVNTWGDGLIAEFPSVVEAVRAAVDGFEASGVVIDILVNNAGIQKRKPLEDFEPGDWRALMAANVDSVFYVGQAVARHMIKRGRGKIINIASVQSEAARPTIAPYTASKGAIRNLTKGMCADWARHGIQVNAIGPGYFVTPLNKALYEDPEFDAWLRKRTPAGRWGRLEDLHGIAVFLASPASDFVNGQTIHVDGGLLSVL